MSEHNHSHERKTSWVVIITATTMVVEIFFGLSSKSMALLADGIHMGSHVLAIGLSWFRILPLFLLWFITVTIVSFYTECEPLHILKRDDLSAKIFLQQKLMKHSKYILLLYIPVLVINTFFNIEYLVLNLLFIPIQLALVWYAICLKYSGYEPNKNSIGNSILLSLVSVGSIVPYLLPIPLLMAIGTYGKAVRNLKNYLND